MHLTDYAARLDIATNSTRLRVVVLLVLAVVPALVLFAVLQSVADRAPSLPQPGSAAPPASLALLYGGDATLNQQRGNVVVLHFWATSCVSCLRELPALQHVADDLQTQRFTLFEVNVQDDAATIDPFRQQLGLRMPILLDVHGDVTRRYGVAELPATVLIDQQGIFRQEHLGPLMDGGAQTEWSTDWLEQQVRSFIASGS